MGLFIYSFVDSAVSRSNWTGFPNTAGVNGFILGLENIFFVHLPLSLVDSIFYFFNSHFLVLTNSVYLKCDKTASTIFKQ